jgi:chaperone modulatory protein CbpM
MQTDHLIPADQFCVQHNIELSFITRLYENGLIEIKTVEQTTFIPEERLPELEKIIRLHYELDINLEGVEAITHLLQRMERLQDELRGLKNRLRLYEANSTGE